MSVSAGSISCTRWFTCFSLRRLSACSAPSRETRCSSLRSSIDCPGASSRRTRSPLTCRMRLALYHRMALFAVCAPGLEPVLAGEVRALGLAGRAVPGGVEVDHASTLPRLNLWLRTASRVLVRMGQFEAKTFPELVRKASGLPWERHAGSPVAFRVTCRKSRLYHSDAVAERLHAALEARLGAKVPLGSAEDENAQLFVARFDRDVCTVS